MRKLKASDIFEKRFLIIEDEIVERENGEFFSEKMAEYMLKNKEKMSSEEINNVKKKDIDILEKEALKYFRIEYEKLLSNVDSLHSLLNLPVKKYEIFSLDVFGGKTILAPLSILPEGENKELYYDFNIANEIYKNLIDINDIDFNEYDEISQLYADDINEKNTNISELRKRDIELFNKDMTSYNMISSTPLYQDYRLLNNDKERLLEENKKLSVMIEEYNEKIRDLSNKLKISLERVEFLQRPKTFSERLKELFIKEKKQVLIADTKGDK